MWVYRSFQVFVFSFILTSPVYFLGNSVALETKWTCHLIIGLLLSISMFLCQRLLSDGRKFTARDRSKSIDRDAFMQRNAVKWCEDAQLVNACDKPHTLRGMFMLVKIIPLVVSGIYAIFIDLKRKNKRSK